MPRMKRRAKGTGALRQLPSGRWQAHFRSPETGQLVPAPTTFETRFDADAWLMGQVRDVDRGSWAPPERSNERHGVRVRDYSETWLRQRELRPSTRANYRRLLDAHLLPAFGDTYIDKI